MKSTDQEIHTVQQVLMASYLAYIAISLLIVVIYETETAEISGISSYPTFVFWFQVVMQLVTISTIPLALYLFRIRRIHHQLSEHKAGALRLWGLIRISMIGIPMMMNTYMYEQTQMPGFGYMAIILLLSSFFITPSKSRCISEVSDN